MLYKIIYTSTLIDVVRFDTTRIQNEIYKNFSKKYLISIGNIRSQIGRIFPKFAYLDTVRNSGIRLFLHFFALFIAFIAFLVNLWMNLKHVSSLSIDLKNRFLEIYGWT